MTETLAEMKPLQPWNPLDHGRLLWWLLVTPERLKRYREIYGRRDEVRLSKWLISTLLFFPFFVPCLTIGLGHLTPATPERSIGAYLWMSLVLFVIWLLGGWRAGTDSWLDRLTLLAVLFGFPTGLVVSLVGLGGERLFLLLVCLLSPLLTARLADALAWDEERGEPLMLAVFAIGILAEFPLHGWWWQSGSQAGQPETYPLLRQSVCAEQSNWVTKGALVLLVGAHAVIILGCFFGG